MASLEISDDEINLTQTTYREPNTVEVDWADPYLYPELTQFCEQSFSDEELSQVADQMEANSSDFQRPVYEDISSASEPEESNATVGLPTDNPVCGRYKIPKTDTEMSGYASRSLAKSTKRKCKWAAELFHDWQVARNRIAQFDTSISAIKPSLEDMTKDELCYSISRFLCEVKKVNGEEYPSQTLYEIVITLQLFLETKGKTYKFLQDPSFLLSTLDHVRKARSQEGFTARNRKAQVITLEEEELLWNRVLGFDTPRKLVDTIQFLLGLNFALRAGTEHRNLRWEKSQLTILRDSNGLKCLRYTEDVSKSNQGGLKHKLVTRKVVYGYENTTNPDRCIVRAYEIYDQHCPEERSAFYLQPLEQPKGEVWFSNQPMGLKTLTKTVGRLCKACGIDGFRTNHSLRATAATRLFDANVDEQLIAEVTGHQSTAVRAYKRSSDLHRHYTNAVVSGQNLYATKPSKCARLDNGGVRKSSEISSTSSTNYWPNITLNVNICK